METTTESGIILDIGIDPETEVEEIPETLDPEELLHVLREQNKGRMLQLVREYGPGAQIDPVLMLNANLSILIDMLLNENEQTTYSLRVETLISHVLDGMEEEIPQLAARQKLVVPEPQLNRQQRRAIQKMAKS